MRKGGQKTKMLWQGWVTGGVALALEWVLVSQPKGLEWIKGSWYSSLADAGDHEAECEA